MRIQELRDRLALHEDPVTYPRAAEMVQMLDTGETEIGIESDDEIDYLLGVEGRNGRRIKL